MTPSQARLAEGDRLLVIRLGAVGDVLRTLPALHLIRKTYPAVRISWIVEDLSRPLLEGHPEIDEVIRFPRRELRADGLRPGRLVSRLAALRTELRERRFAATLDFQGSLKSGLLSLLTGAPRRLGFAPGHSREVSFLCANEWVRPRSPRVHRVERNVVMAGALGASGDEITMVLPERPDEGAAAEEILRAAAPGDAPVVILSPGTSRRQRRKSWPATHYAHLAGLIRTSLPGVPLVVWGPCEEDLARSIVRGSGGAARMAPATSLRLLAALLRRSALFVGADTGPMHLAWGVGCPVVALFGPTDPRLNAPLGSGHVVLRAGRSAAAITPDQVLAAARDILERAPKRASPGEAPRLSRLRLFPALAGPVP